MPAPQIGERRFVPQGSIGSGGSQINIVIPAAVTDSNNVLGAGASAKFVAVDFEPKPAGADDTKVSSSLTGTGTSTTVLNDSTRAFTTTDGVKVGDEVQVTGGTGGSPTQRSTVSVVGSATQLTVAPALATAVGVTNRATGTASSGTTTTLVDTTKDFVALGVVVGDVITTTGGTGSGQSLVVTAVGGAGNHTLTFATATAPDATTTYSVDGNPTTYKVLAAGPNNFRGVTVERVA